MLHKSQHASTQVELGVLQTMTAQGGLLTARSRHASAGDGKRLKKWIGDAFRYTSKLQKSSFRSLRLKLGSIGLGKSHRLFKVRGLQM